jgi:hypothetical protein
MSKKSPDKCVNCGTGKTGDTKGNFTYYGCGSVSVKADKANPVLWSSCPKHDRERYKGDKSKALLSGGFMFDSGGRHSWIWR